MRIPLWTVVLWGCSGGASDEGSATDATGTDVAGDADTDADSDSDADSDADTDADPACKSWLVTYDLTGSVFHIESTQNFDVVLQQPYSDDLNMGPGTLVLRMPDDGGVPGAGPAALTEYELDLNFIVGVGGIADVTTDLVFTGGPDECGIATGAISGTQLDWSPPEMSSVCQNGQITCEGPLCGQFGSPPEDEPEILTDECDVQALDTFTFSQDLKTFDMPAITLVDDPDSTETLTFHGKVIEAVLDPNPPACACP